MQPNNRGPWVVSAFFCDAVAIDGASQNVMEYRFPHDTLSIDLAVGPPQPASVILALRFAGRIPETVPVRIVGRFGIDGPVEFDASFPATIDGGQGGHRQEVKIDLPVERAGTIWFDVLIRGVLVVRTPFTIEHAAGSGKLTMN